MTKENFIIALFYIVLIGLVVVIWQNNIILRLVSYPPIQFEFKESIPEEQENERTYDPQTLQQC